MEGYYALAQHWPAPWIGSEEIRRWIRDVKGVRPPSNTTVLTALRKAGVQHRSAGQPRGGRSRLDDVGAPFLPREFPRGRARSAR
jgi:hypothetical protein